MQQYLGLKEKLATMDVHSIETMYIDMMTFISRHKNTKHTKESERYMQQHKQDTCFVQGYLHARLEALKS